MKTAIDVLLDLKALLEGSLFAQSLNGGLYFDETRPKNSKKEDLVLVFTQGFSHQVERGTITILAYVADIPTDGGNTTPQKNKGGGGAGGNMGEWLKRGKEWQLSISTRTNYFSLPTARDKAAFCLYQTRLQVFRWNLLTHTKH